MPMTLDDGSRIYLDEVLLNVAKKLTPGEVMHQRWSAQVKNAIPEIDSRDLPLTYARKFDYAEFPLGAANAATEV